jgi:TrmH family RNA methyltransferase
MLSSGHVVTRHGPASPARTRISSRQHALVAQCRDLARAAHDGRVLLDGAHLVLDALRAGATLDAVLTTTETTLDPTLSAALDRSPTPVYEVTTAVMDAASPVRTPSGLVAIARWAPASLETLFGASQPLIVGLVDVQDPGNVGAVIRTADALGATGVAALGQSADPAGWKALRGSMGSAFRIPVARLPLADAFASARRHQVPIVAAVARDGVRPEQAGLQTAALLLLGNEGAGLAAEVTAHADVRVTLPMRAGVESLNVSVAAALLIDAARRQRAD